MCQRHLSQKIEPENSNKRHMKIFTRLSTLLLLFGLTFSQSSLAEVIIISDNGSGTGTSTWTSDNVYLLDGFVFVSDGQILTIEAGTVIKGMPGSGADASALVVARGGKLMAMGTADAPIIFTFEADALDGSTPYDTRGQWGGLIILGAAGLNSTPGETQIEGIPETEPRGLYGGSNDEDDSGTIQYISIRHGGTDIGAGNEINGLTLGGVGNGTTIEHVEVIANADDGIEFFGGTVELKWACVAFVGDDSFDYDEGWRGKGQFWFTVQDDPANDAGDRGGEHDGGTDPEDGNPYATPMIYNATYLGKGMAEGKRALTFRDNAGGKYNNSIFQGWGKGIDIENLASGEDSYARFEDGELSFSGNCFWDVAVTGTDASASDLFKISMGSGWANESDSTNALISSTEMLQASFTDNGNEVVNPGLVYTVAVGSGGNETGMGVVPTNANFSGVEQPSDMWFTDADYKGAFDPQEACEPWIQDWTMLDQYGFVGCYGPTGVEEQGIPTLDLNLFPNPSNGQFSLQVNQNMASADISIFNMSGQLVYRESGLSLQSGSHRIIDISSSTDGIYMVRLTHEDSVSTSRILKH